MLPRTLDPRIPGTNAVGPTDRPTDRPMARRELYLRIPRTNATPPTAPSTDRRTHEISTLTFQEQMLCGEPPHRPTDPRSVEPRAHRSVGARAGEPMGSSARGPVSPWVLRLVSPGAAVPMMRDGTEYRVNGQVVLRPTNPDLYHVLGRNAMVQWLFLFGPTGSKFSFSHSPMDPRDLNPHIPGRHAGRHGDPPTAAQTQEISTLTFHEQML